MGGIELREGRLIVNRPPNELDELAIAFSQILDEFEIAHVFVAGYVSILAGRARATEDIDVIIEPVTEETADRLATELKNREFWGPAMPLESMPEMFDAGDPIWVAPTDQITPHLEVKVATDEFDRASLRDALVACIDEASIPIGPLELQIAYKLYLGTRTDIEDAIHLYSLFEETLSAARLEAWVTRLDVDQEYERLKRA